MLAFSKPSPNLAVPREFSAVWIGDRDAIRARRRFKLDHATAVIGRGDEAFARVRDSVKRFDMARQNWLTVEPTEPVLERGTQIAVTARVWPVWATSIGMITGVDETQTSFALSYGTTRDHVAVGEERFDVELHDNGDVVFAITAVSRPAKWFVWAIYPFVRMQQARFRRTAIRLMKASAAEK